MASQARDQRAPEASSPAVRAVMQGNRSRDTRPELALRRALHALGLRYRVHQVLKLPGGKVTPDVVFPSIRVAVEVQGCFWHGCAEHGRRPNVANPGYWGPKIERNRARDERNALQLSDAGWCLVTVWEHEPVEVAAHRVKTVVMARREAAVGRNGR